jgi:hypothetical protein
VLPGGALFAYAGPCLLSGLVGCILAWAGLDRLLVALASLLIFGASARRLLRRDPWQAAPLTVQPGTFCTMSTERSYWTQLNIVLLLAAFAGPFHSLFLLLAFAPLILFRLGSRLWTELDLTSGRVLYHRTFLGMQVTRPGGNLEGGTAVRSGLPTNRPGQPLTYAVSIVDAEGRNVPVRSDAPDLATSRDFGRRLARQLDLPHLVGNERHKDSDWPRSIHAERDPGHTPLPWTAS